MSARLTHLDPQGRARMVDVSGKKATLRKAAAEGCLSMSPQAFALARGGRLPKGDLLAVARVAGILGAKATPHLVPLCHPVALAAVEVDFEWRDEECAVWVLARTVARDATGVEMEALAACAAACLALYDMVKGVDRCAQIGPMRLLQKSGGRSGRFRRDRHVHAPA